MKFKKIKKTILCTAFSVLAFMTVGIDAFSLIDYSAGESGLVNNESTPYKVNIVAEGKNVAVVPIGIGLRGDADASNDVSIYDAIKIAKHQIGIAGDDFKGSFGYAMADTNSDGNVDIYDAINIAKYLITKGTHDEKWKKILEK